MILDPDPTPLPASLVAALLLPEAWRGRNVCERVAHRNAAAAALLAVCGLRPNEIAHLSPDDLLPGGRSEVVVRPTSGSGMWTALERTVPVLPAGRSVLERYLALRPDGRPEPLFYFEVMKHMRPQGLLGPQVLHGRRLRSFFVRCVTAADPPDGTIQALLGIACADPAGGWKGRRPGTDELMAFLARVHPLGREEGSLTRRLARAGNTARRLRDAGFADASAKRLPAWAWDRPRPTRPARIRDGAPGPSRPAGAGATCSALSSAEGADRAGTRAAQVGGGSAPGAPAG